MDFHARGVFVPTPLIFHPQLPASVLVSWIKLRSLAWDGWRTPPMSLPELASHLGLHPQRLVRHLAQLEEISALSLHKTAGGKIILSFPQQPVPLPTAIPATPASASPAPYAAPLQPDATLASYFPTRILGYLSYEDDEHDPLYIAGDRAEVSSPVLKPGREFSKFSICKPAEHVFVGK